jgi:hypothetical protein
LFISIAQKFIEIKWDFIEINSCLMEIKGQLMEIGKDLIEIKFNFISIKSFPRHSENRQRRPKTRLLLPNGLVLMRKPVRGEG